MPSKTLSAAERAKTLRYKRPALASMGFEMLQNELYEISEKCSEIHWWTDTDDETLVAAMDGDEDDAWEFRLAFSELDTACERLYQAIQENCIDAATFDDCTVALIGNQYNLVGFDSYVEDYFALAAYDTKLAATDAGKRVLRMTKPDMISTIGQCFGILIAFLDVRQRFDYLSATFDILRGRNNAVIDTVKQIEKLYEKSCDNWLDCEKFDALVNTLPSELWVM